MNQLLVPVRSLLTIAACLALWTGLRAQTSRYTRTETGVRVFPHPSLGGQVTSVDVSVLAEGIIRVQAFPAVDLGTKQSLVVVPGLRPSVTWNLVERGDSLEIGTTKLRARISLLTGGIAYYDGVGRPLGSERRIEGRSLRPVVHEGHPLYAVTQLFESGDHEAYYGFGQHQDNIMDHRGRQVVMFQNNTEVAVPFLLSTSNYGILWDNYALTTAGDTRPYMSLTSLCLRDKDGNKGWLTASYYNNAGQQDKPDHVRAESDIAIRYLNESRQILPAGFNTFQGKVVWEGSIDAEWNSPALFRFMYAGYLKVWIDGKLACDRWRQAWNPGTVLVEAKLEKGRQIPIRIEWLPDGGESYIGASWNTIPADKDIPFGFASEAGRQIDYYFIHGANMDSVVGGYRWLTGKAPIPPKWAFGLWQSRERYKTQAEILETVRTFREKKIPLDNIVLDWSYWKENDWGSQEFDSTRFPDPRGMIQRLHQDYHTQFMISVWPKFYEGIPAYQRFRDNGWLYMRNVADRQRDWIGKGYVSTFYDAFDAKARKAFWDLLQEKLYSLGIDAWWMDASEPDILSNVSPQKRKEQMIPLSLGTAAEYLNAYPLENARGIYEGQRGADKDKRVFLLTRSGFAGSQRYGAVIWSGDVASRWHDLKDQVTAGLNFSMSGLPYWTMDIGGFSVERRYEKPNPQDLEEWREQMTRWYQFGAFCPLFRVHGQFPLREIYHTAPESHPAYQSMLYYDKLRYRLLPYIYSLAGQSWLRNYTPMRALAMEFGQDRRVWDIRDQYLFGPSILVNPVMDYQRRSRSLYLPGGQGWYDFYTGVFHAGGQTVVADAPYERLPLYVREGSILPIGPDLQYTAEKPADPITLYVYTGKDASFDLYEDEGTTNAYERGEYSVIPIRYHQSSGTLTIGQREGSYPGMLTARAFRIVWVDRRQGANPAGADKPGRTLTYSGKRIDIQKPSTP